MSGKTFREMDTARRLADAESDLAQARKEKAEAMAEVLDICQRWTAHSEEWKAKLIAAEARADALAVALRDAYSDMMHAWAAERVLTQEEARRPEAAIAKAEK